MFLCESWKLYLSLQEFGLLEQHIQYILLLLFLFYIGIVIYHILDLLALLQFGFILQFLCLLLFKYFNLLWLKLNFLFPLFLIIIRGYVPDLFHLLNKFIHEVLFEEMPGLIIGVIGNEFLVKVWLL